MQINKTSQEGDHVVYEIIMPMSMLEECIEKEVQEKHGNEKIKGFRPGHVPIPHLVKLFGREVRIELLNRMLSDTVQSIIDDNSYKLAVVPIYDVKETDNGENVIAKVDMFLFPEIQDLPFDKDEFPVYEPDEEVSKQLYQYNMDLVRYSLAGYSTAPDQEVIKAWDKVKINVEVSSDGIVLPNMTGEIDIVVGRNLIMHEIEQLILGRKAGEIIEENFDFTETTPVFSALDGRSGLFHVEILSHETPALVVVDQEYLRKIGFEKLDDLEENIRNTVQENIKTIIYNDRKKRFCARLVELHNYIDIPDAICSNETNMLMYKACDMVGTKDFVTDAYRDHCAHKARQSLLSSFVVCDFANKNEIKVSDDEVSNFAQKHISELSEMLRGQSEKEAKKTYQEFLDKMRIVCFENKSVDEMVKKLTTQVQKIGFEEFKKIAQGVNLNEKSSGRL